MVAAGMKLKDACSLEGKLWQTSSIKKQRHHFANKGPSSQIYGWHLGVTSTNKDFFFFSLEVGDPRHWLHGQHLLFLQAFTSSCKHQPRSQVRKAGRCWTVLTMLSLDSGKADSFTFPPHTLPWIALSRTGHTGTLNCQGVWESRCLSWGRKQKQDCVAREGKKMG